MDTDVKTTPINKTRYWLTRFRLVADYYLGKIPDPRVREKIKINDRFGRRKLVCLYTSDPRAALILQDMIEAIPFILGLSGKLLIRESKNGETCGD